jgi:hypothetical protein
MARMHCFEDKSDRRKCDLELTFKGQGSLKGHGGK